jgi:hypothetical protein
MPGIFSNAKLNFNTGGGPKKAGLVNSWNWPSIPYKFLPRTIAATIQEIIDYLLGLLTTVYGNPTDAATADVSINQFINFVVALGETSISGAAGVGTDFVKTNAALTAGGYPADFIFTDTDPRPGMGATANTTAFITNLNTELAETTTELERRVIIAEWYLKSGFLGIAAQQPGSASLQATTAGLNTTVIGLTWTGFYTATTPFTTAVAAKNAVNVIANSPLNGLTDPTEKAIVVQVFQDILDAA